MRKRVQSLDYLRGLMALGIMIYHYFLWSGGKFEADTILGRIGIYGVSVFYVLSGLTLYVVYNKLELKSIHLYFIKRIFRIFPLLWLCIALTVYFNTKHYDSNTMILNVTGLFGFVAPSKYIAAASWSIGNELVFYALFPLILITGRKSKVVWILLMIISLVITTYFAYQLIKPEIKMAAQWKIYIQPLNQMILFISGAFIGYLFNGKTLPRFAGILMILLPVLVFVIYPVSGDSSHLVSGTNRLLFILLSVTVTAGFFVTEFRIGKFPAFVMSKLGEISYSVYLIHPLVFNFMKRQLQVTDKFTLLFFSFIVTLVFSFLIYNFYEKKFIQLGQTITSYKSVAVSINK